MEFELMKKKPSPFIGMAFKFGIYFLTSLKKYVEGEKGSFI